MMPILQLGSPKVYKNHKLNNANFGDFTHNDYQVFLHLISKVGGVDRCGKYLQPQELQREYVLNAREFSELFNADLSNSYKTLYKACRKLMKTSILLEDTITPEVREINVCSMAEYNKDRGCITIQFTDAIMPYIAQVKAKFILYNLKEISNFSSFYTTRLYELIQEFKETGWMLKSVEQLREAFAVGDKLEHYADFKRKTFAHACREINNNYDMRLKFEEIKIGRKVIAVKFVFEKTLVYRAVNQRTGIETNVYKKPSLVSKKRSKTVAKISSGVVLEGQLSLDDLQQNEQGSKPMKGILSSILTKLFPK